MLEMSHNHWLIVASLAVAMMSGFTGLSLLKGASQTSIEKRKFNVALASIAMGGGIWSMHFVAMLGLQLPIPFFYEILTTLVSALIAILVVCVALLILHFVNRDRTAMIGAGILVGLGIIIMHYVGMSGMRGAVPQYSMVGVVFAVCVSVTLGVTTFFAAYGNRQPINILMGTVLFGIAVFAVHFIAMHGTSFLAAPNDYADKIVISNEILAIGVSTTTFLICGAFLMTSITFFSPTDLNESPPVSDGAVSNPAPAELTIQNDEPAAPEITENTSQQEIVRVPFEKDGRSHFIHSDQILAVRAEGHYTLLYSDNDRLFCPLSISEITKRLSDTELVTCHRSYIINPKHVSGFERKKDNGVCYFEGNTSMEKVPVSRSRLKEVQQALGLI